MEAVNGFVKFLDYGTPGLCALFLVLSYFLLSSQSKKGKADGNVLKNIRFFMVMSVVLAVVSVVSSFVPAPSPKEAGGSDPNRIYSVTGRVKKDDGSGTGDNVKVWKGPTAEFPTLCFEASNYYSVPIDLNDTSKVTITDNHIAIKDSILLIPEDE